MLPKSPISVRGAALAAIVAVLGVPSAMAGPDAPALADRVLAWTGDLEQAVPFIRFTYVLEKDGKEMASRTHYLDFRGKRHRVEMTDDKGREVICLTHLPSRIGACEVDDRGIIEEEAAPFLAMANEARLHDLHWLLMPAMLHDPGTRAGAQSTARFEGKPYEVLDVSFDAAEAPYAGCRLFVDAATGRVDRAECRPAASSGGRASGEPEGWAWSGWTPVGDVKLAMERAADGGSMKIHFRDVEVFKTLHDRVFVSTAEVDLRIQAPPGR